MRTKVLRKGTACILSAIMVLGGTNVTIPGIVPLLEVGAEESSDSDFTIVDGVLTAYNGDGGDVVISEGVTAIGEGATFSNNDNKISTSDNDVENSDFVIADGVLVKYTGDGGDVVIPEGVTAIGDWAFAWCESLTSIEIPEGVTTIGDYVFWSCSSLTSIKIPEGVTTIGDCAFTRCSSLTSIEIPEGVTTIGVSEFLGCSSLTSIEIPESVTTIGDSAFASCSSLTSIEIPEGVTTIGDYAFYDCYSMTSIEVNPANMNYKSIDGILYKNDTLIKCPAGKTGSVEIPEGVTTIGDSAFEGCSSLTSIEIPESVTTIGNYAFYDCHSMTSIEVNPANMNYKSIDGILYKNDTLITYPAGKTGSVEIPEDVTTIGDGAFRGCSSLTSIEIPEGVTTIGDGAFRGCSSLTSIEIPEGVTTIGDWAFYECYNLTSIEIPESVTYIGYYAIGYRYDDDDDWHYVRIEDFIIYGYPGTAAETYANEHHLTFIALDEAAVTYGDVSGDGVIDSKDAVLVKRYTSGWSVEINEDAADVNGDGAINSKDAVLIERYVAGWDVMLGK